MIKNEIMLDAEYADIIISLLHEPYAISSISKLVFISFCVKHESNLSSYANRSKDFVDCFFKNISLKLSAHYDELNSIFRVIDLLERNSFVQINDDSIELVTEFKHEPENHFLKFCQKKTPNPIIEINKLNAKALIEEVIRYV